MWKYQKHSNYAKDQGTQTLFNPYGKSQDVILHAPVQENDEIFSSHRNSRMSEKERNSTNSKMQHIPTTHLDEGKLKC